jgi:hypothetical protein
MAFPRHASDNVGSVRGHVVEREHKIDSERALRTVQHKHVGKSMCCEAVQCSGAIGPLLIQPLSIPADDWCLTVTECPKRSSQLKPCGEYNAVDGVLFPTNHHTVGRQSFDTLGIVDQLDGWTIKRWEVVVVKARPLTKLVIPRLQGIGGGGIVNN